jgi:hypothetical protein
MSTAFKAPAAQLARVWTDPAAFGLTLLTVFLDVYVLPARDPWGPASPLHWDPATLDMELHDDFGVDVSPASFDRLQTAIRLFTTDDFFQSVPDFVHACTSLAGTFCPADTVIFPDCAEIAWGITEGLLIQPAEDEAPNPFSPEVVGFISQALEEEGIITPPDVLRIATRERSLMDRVSYDFSDDPELFSAIQQTESDRTNTINQEIHRRLQLLLQQLHALPLTHGRTQFVTKLLAKLPRGTAPPPLAS